MIQSNPLVVNEVNMYHGHRSRSFPFHFKVKLTQDWLRIGASVAA
jgi:hypothetical protein